ncbi:succinate--CoA ligase [Candidatus Acidianus copahuensis]|uniref:Succinate--CoA ligase n=1 Tax=Candidatus Acidianus copahuensis TaxID=1160895 RepID=A0A031LJZ0_9CREN|nr:succinate--CoA ligase subunit beta [Candidatus Acidianus copahuensis]EZQ01800.1 succinate--CoA ligase [Candidatus Acidianus copahuensis]
MKLYEYEGKLIFSKVGIPIPKGIVTEGRVVWNGKAVVKAQLLEGGRGKRGLVKVTDDVNKTIEEMRNSGIGKFLVEEVVEHTREIYMSIMMDRSSGEPMLVSSPQGGINVEEASDIKTLIIPIERGPRGYDIFTVEKYLRVKGLESVIKGLYKIVTEYDADLAEINPLAVTDRGVIALDSKVILDDNALFRHEELLKEIGRKEESDNYVELDGDIGIIGNGAGLTMATMDMVKLMGGMPADFLDVGGGADKERVKECVLKVGNNPKVKKILINIYGGITRCDQVAEGIISAYTDVKKPIFVRLVGTNEEEGWKMLEKVGIKFYQDVESAVGDVLR